MNSREEKTAFFAGGCFWCLEDVFSNTIGVTKVISGYSGGKLEFPSYDEVTCGGTGHRETVKVVFDPKVISYKRLLEIYWKQINPTDNGGQFYDRGFHYTTAIFYADMEQKIQAELSRRELNASKKFPVRVVTKLIEFTNFFPAEKYHQNFSKTSAFRYKLYKKGSGRDEFSQSTWGCVL